MPREDLHPLITGKGTTAPLLDPLNCAMSGCIPRQLSTAGGDLDFPVGMGLELNFTGEHWRLQ